MTIETAADLKKRLRREALERRAALPHDLRGLFSRRLVEQGLALAERFEASIVSAFYPIRNEPDTLALLEALAFEGVSTALPVIVSRTAPLQFRRWRPGEPTIPGDMNIPEPPASAETVEPDLLFVPLAAFDRRGHRIGFGAGYYDRTLSLLRAKKRVCAVGVAYATSEVETAPDEPHDERLDFILTEQDLIDARSPA